MCFGIEKPRGRSDATPLYTAPPSGVQEGMLRAAEIARGCAKHYDALAEKDESQAVRNCAADIAKGYRGAEYAITRAAEQVNAEGHTRIPVYLDQCAPSALTPPTADGVVVPRDVLKRCREAMWAYAPVTAALTKSDDPLVRELDALLAAAKEPRK